MVLEISLLADAENQVGRSVQVWQGWAKMFSSLSNAILVTGQTTPSLCFRLLAMKRVVCSSLLLKLYLAALYLGHFQAADHWVSYRLQLGMFALYFFSSRMSCMTVPKDSAKCDVHLNSWTLLAACSPATAAAWPRYRLCTLQLPPRTLSCLPK